MQIPNDVLAFQDQFQTDDDCLRYLAELRWLKGFNCPKCEHDVGYMLKTRAEIQCAVCRHQTSVTAGTLFHGTKVPLRKWFWMIFLVAQDKKGASSSRLARQLGMYQKTVWYMLQKLRHAMGCRDEAIMLSGFIELDQALIGPHARKTGRRKNQDGKKPRQRLRGRKPKDGRKRKTQTEVVVVVEQDPGAAGMLAMNVVSRTTRDSIREVVERRVEPNQHIKTDGYQANYVLKSMGHVHQAVVCDGVQACKELPIVHQVIGLLKNNLLGIYHGVSSRYLPRYLSEFAFRFNRRFSKIPVWVSLAKAALFAGPLSYADAKL